MIDMPTERAPLVRTSATHKYARCYIIDPFFTNGAIGEQGFSHRGHVSMCRSSDATGKDSVLFDTSLQRPRAETTPTYGLLQHVSDSYIIARTIGIQNPEVQLHRARRHIRWRLLRPSILTYRRSSSDDICFSEPLFYISLSYLYTVLLHNINSNIRNDLNSEIKPQTCLTQRKLTDILANSQHYLKTLLVKPQTPL
jgi:hypothetical protein